MIDERKEQLIEDIAALVGDEMPDVIKFKRFLRKLTPYELRERYEILIDQQAQAIRDSVETYTAMMSVATARTDFNAETQRSQSPQRLAREITDHKLRISQKV